MNDAETYINHVFDTEAAFEGATFDEDISFAGARFKRTANFSNARFLGTVWFDGATFEERAIFASAAFCKGAYFGGATFQEDLDFGDAIFDGQAFGRRRFTVVGALRLSGARFTRRMNLVLAADALDCNSTFLDAGGVWELRWAEIDLRRAVIQQLLVVSHDTSTDTDDEELVDLCTGGAAARQRRHPDDELARRRSRTAAPRVLSVAASSVEDLVLSGVDLRACRFAGAYNLDQLRVDEGCSLPRTPGWTGRSAIAEEHLWRAMRGPAWLGQRWYGDEHKLPLQIGDDTPTPASVAALYRALRKGLEDHKDEPGAADFYYGEMEMRRHTGAPGGFGRRLASWFERLTIWLYWALSGYALRPSRALAALVLLVAIAAGAQHQYGFVDVARPFEPPARARSDRVPPVERLPDSLGELRDAVADGDALVYSLSTAAALAPLPNARLTSAGRTIRTVERILGPVLVGLVLLSIRGRVKR